MASKSRLFSQLLGAGTSGTIPVTSLATDVPLGTEGYPTVSVLPLTGNNVGDQAFVQETNRLYIWNGTGWYNIALINTNPSITGGYNSSYLFATDGTPIEITLVGSDPEGIPLTWSYEVTTGSLTNGGGTTATVSNVDNVFTITPTTTQAYAGAFSITWKASDGVNLGTAVSSFTLSFKVVNSKYTSLLVKGLASGNNATFVDSSTNNFTITKNGDVTQGTFSPFSQPECAWSNYFNGSTDYLSVPYSTDLDLTQGDFTVEAWINPSAYVQGEIIELRNGSSGTAGWLIRWKADGTVSCGYIGPSGGPTSVSTLSLGVWTHIAWTRTGTTSKLYINGVEDVSVSISNGSTDTSSLTIGSGYGGYFNGYISNIRVIKGTAIYTSNFTPSTEPLTAVTGTGLLTCQSNHFKDNSTNGFAITVNGNTSVSPFCPFDRLAYGPAIHGGSAYFDGTGDYLLAQYGAELALGTSDFTLEAWVYLKGSNNGSTAFILNNNSILFGYVDATGNKLSLYMSSSGGNSWDIANAVVITNDLSLVLNRWSHIALTRSSTSFSVFFNGTQVSTFTSSLGIYDDGVSQSKIGQHWSGLSTSFDGHISNVRLVKGTAVYTSAFTPPTAPLTAITNTSLLLNCTNADIIDNDSKNNLKLVGNTAASSTQTKYAVRSVYFPGVSGNYVTVTLPTIIEDFTFECWVYPINLSSGRAIFTTNLNGTNKELWIPAGADLYLGGSGYFTNTTLSVGAWSHIALVRYSGTIFCYVNGVKSVTSYAVTTDFGGVCNIGGYAGGNDPMYGYIEDLRITKGLARYTANFTPPTAELLG